MIFPINKKHTFFSKEKTLLTFFFILFISFSAFGQQDKKLILLQTSDVHSRLEPINQEGDRNYDKGGFVRRATFVKVPQRASRYVIVRLRRYFAGDTLL